MSYLEELLPEFRKGAKIRQVTWAKDTFIYLNKKNNLIYDEKGRLFNVEFCNILSLEDWEFYIKPIDWDYIIKNNCLCWFWDEDYEEGRTLGYLSDILKDRKEKFLKNGITYWEHCCPVRKDEVAFYTITKGEKEND